MLLLKVIKSVVSNFTLYPPFNYDGGSTSGIGSDRKGKSSDCTLTSEYSIEVEEVDRGSSCTYATAVSYCSNKGSGWHIPTMIELKAMYDNRTILQKNGVATFGNNWYWSSSVYNGGAKGCRCVLIFKDGKFEFNYMTSVNYVRCVRDL